MLITTHILAGLLLGKYLGHTGAILLGMTLLDLDHVWDMIIRGRKHGFKKAFETLIMPYPEEDESRTIFHSLLGWLIVSIILYNLNPDFGLYYSIGYFVHLMMDSLDTSKLHLFYPTKYDVRGWVEYNSLMEYMLGIVMFIIYFFF